MRGHLSVTREAAFIGYQLIYVIICSSSRSRSFGSVRSCGRSRGVSVVVPPRALREGLITVTCTSALFQYASERERDGHKRQMLCLASVVVFS